MLAQKLEADRAALEGPRAGAFGDTTPAPAPMTRLTLSIDGLETSDGLELDALRGNQGTQYYEVPSGTDVGPGWTVLVWCRAFGVPVANAGQAAS